MMRFPLVLILVIGAFCRLWANCTAPSLLSVSTVTDTSAVLTWTDVGDNYELEVRKLSESFSGVPTHVVPGDPPYTITGLVPGEQYRFRVRAVCSGGGESAWSVTRNFATDLNNERPCPLDYTLRDTTCTSGGQIFELHVGNAPGTLLGTDVFLKGVRLVVVHPWRSDLKIWLTSPDGTRVQLISGLNAGDQNLGNPAGNGGCGQYMELTDDPAAPLLSAAAETDNITGLWQSFSPLSAFATSQNPNGTWLLEICDNKLNHTGKLRLAQLVFDPASCAAPTGLAVENIALNAADISWDAGSVAGDSVQLVYGPAGFIPGSAAGISIDAPAAVAQPFALDALVGLSEFDVYIRQLCAPGVWSGYGNPVSFFTVCPATLIENFDTLGICPTACADACPLPGLWQNAPGDDYEWKVRTGQGITFPTAGPPSASGGSGNYLFFRNSCTGSGANGKKAVLRTLCVDIDAPAGTNCHFSLDLYMNTKLGQMGSLLLEVSTNGGVSWQPVRNWSGNQGKGWKREFVNLGSFDGQTALLQLTATGVTGAYGDIAIDNLTFYGSVQAGSPDYTFYRDADGDGFGDTGQKLIACSPATPSGYSTIPGDCEDQNAGIFPGATEVKCNGVDENCNGMTDDQFIPAPVIIPNNGICAGNNAVVFIQNPQPAGQYFWFDAATGGQMIGAGNMVSLTAVTTPTTVWVMDSLAIGGCASSRVSTTVPVLPVPVLVSGQMPEICQGVTLDLGAVNINDVAQTTGSQTYHAMSPPSLANQFTNLVVQPTQTTSYVVVKTTTDGCADTLAIPVTVFQNPTAAITNGETLAVCKGRPVSLTAAGTPGVSWSWSNGLNFNTIAVIANGSGGNMTTYTVTATDIHGCTATDQLVLETLSGISQTNVAGIQHVLTCGGNEGSIALQPLDGLAPFTFSWTGPNMSSGTIPGIGVNGGVINGLSQGGYRITVTDATGGGCSMVLPSLVINAPGLTVASPVITQPVCAGNTGSISVVATGVAPTYQWSNTAVTASVSGLTPGIYTVTITDGNCQQVLGGLEITSPPALQILANGVTPIDCFGDQNGAINIATLGGTPAYTFLWSDGINTEDRTGLAPGMYQVTVTDIKLCTAVSVPFFITQPDALQVTVTVDDVHCFGGADGGAAIVISGGTQPYFTEWSTGRFDQSIQEVTAGNYQVSVTDEQGCTAIIPVLITEPQPLEVAEVDVQNIDCVGLTGGSLSPAITGGTLPYQYLWSNGQTTATATGLDAGDYAFTLTDAHSCVLNSFLYTVEAPQLLDIDIDSLAHVRCFGGNDGAFKLTINGTQGGYTLLVNNQPAAPQQYFLVAGIYEIAVVDSRGCAISTNVIIGQPEIPLTAQVISAQDAGCAGEPSGSIEVSTMGGTPPYLFNWSNGAVTEDLEVIPAGPYSLLVTDMNNCMAGITNIVIQEPAPVNVVTDISPVPCYGNPFGRILLQTTGGVAPYEYQWSNGATTQNIYDLAAGDYEVSVFDATGCLTVYDSLVVIDKSADFQLQLGFYQPVSCTAGNDGVLRIQTINGRAPFQYAWSAPVGLHANSNLPYDDALHLSGGAYMVTVTDADGCYQSAGPFLVEESPKITLQINDIQSVICKNAHTGAIAVSASGGVPPLSFFWSNGAETPAIDSLPAGNYVVTITDFRGCSAVSGLIQIAEPAIALTINPLHIIQDICSNGTGLIDISVTGGEPLYQYQWSTAATTADIDSLTTGVYSVTVTDQAGCTSTAAFEMLPQLPAMQLASYSVQDVDCFGAETGAISTGVSGGNAPLMYFWSNGALTPNVTNLAAGLYAVTVIDDQGCAAIFYPPEVMAPSAPLSATFTPAMLPDGFSIALNCAGGTPGYTAAWDNATGNQTGLVAIGLAKGTYSVTITDANGCTLVKSIPIGLTSSGDLQNIENQIHIAPNPFLQQCCLDWPAFSAPPEMIRLTAANGQKMDFNTRQTSGRICLDTGSLPAGLILVEVFEADGRYQVVKVLKTLK